jgi:cytochrome c biogenesis protein CcdA
MDIMLAADVEHIINNILGYAIYALGAAAPVMFIVFLILCIVQIIKVKKKGAGKAKAIVFGCISGYYLLVTGAEIAFVVMMASAVAHM